MMTRAIALKITSWNWVERMVRHSFLFRRLVKRFIAGNTLEEAIIASEDLVAKGFLISLDLLGENVKSEKEALEAKASYIKMLETLAKSPCGVRRTVTTTDGKGVSPHPIETSNISIKLTQCGFDQSDAFVEANYREVLEVAQRLDTFVRVDMESSAYTERTIALMQRVFPDFPNTGTVVQSYLHRTLEDVETLIRLGVRVRLVKGAYFEPATVAHQRMGDVEAAYIKLSKRLLDAGHYPAIATHNSRLIEAVKAYVAEKGIDREAFEFQMIYGVRRDLQEQLRSEAFNVRVYVPFGPSWYPYFTRRLAERPANMFFIIKSLFKG